MSPEVGVSTTRAAAGEESPQLKQRVIREYRFTQTKCNLNFKKGHTVKLSYNQDYYGIGNTFISTLGHIMIGDPALHHLGLNQQRANVLGQLELFGIC